jgi:hypothetical protein
MHKEGVFTEHIHGIFQGAAGAQDWVFVIESYLVPETGMAYPFFKDVMLVMQVDTHGCRSKALNLVEQVLEEGFAQDRHKRLWDMIRQRTQSFPEPGSEDEGGDLLIALEGDIGHAERYFDRCFSRPLNFPSHTISTSTGVTYKYYHNMTTAC